MLGKDKRVKKDDIPDSGPVSMVEKTIIGEHISIEGSILGKEDLLIEGSVKGSVKLDECHLTVGTKGQVEGEIQAENVTISGRLMGNIKARGKVEITKEADFNGEIKAKNISVEDGAYLKAVIELEREPEKKAAPLGKLTGLSASVPGNEPITLTGDSDKRK